MTDHKHLIRLQAAKHEYVWGRRGSSSLAARLASNAIGHAFHPDEGKCYAEIWMGTHQNGPAHLFDAPSRPLLDLIRSHPKFYLGEKLLTACPSRTHVPYLFKVLSIRKTLPLQVHPDKGLAEQLRRSDPDTFVDANHKPEIVIAVGEPLCITRAKYAEEGTATIGHAEVDDPATAFVAFIGFRPLEDIKAFLEKVPELVAAIEEPELVIEFTRSPSKELLKQVFAKLLKRGAEAREEVAAAVDKLQGRMMQNGAYVLGSRESELLFRLFMKVNAQYPGDAGVLATTFFMNFVKLRKGEALYIGEDEVHAYMEGDVIECMAVSDDVVSATVDSPPSLIPHADTFANSLTCASRPASHWALPAQSYQKSRHHRTVKYDPPSEEFAVIGTFLSALKTKEETLDPVDGPSIGIVTRGKLKVSASSAEGRESLELDEGSVVFVPPGNQIQMEVIEGNGPQGAGEVWWVL